MKVIAFSDYPLKKFPVAFWLVPSLCVFPVAFAVFALRVFPVMFENSGFAYPAFTSSIERYRFGILFLSVLLAIVPIFFARDRGLTEGKMRFFLFSMLVALGVACVCLVALALPILGLASVSRGH